MIEFLKAGKKWFLIFTIPYLCLLFITIVPQPYEVTTPGGLNKVDSVIRIEESYPQMGTIHTIYVYSFDKISLLQYWAGLLDHHISVEPVDPDSNLSGAEQRFSGEIMKDVSMINSVILAYKKANKDIVYEYEGVIAYVTYATTHPNIELGDIITHVNGTLISNRNEFVTMVNAISCDTEFQVNLVRKGTVMNDVAISKITQEDGCYIGILTYDLFNITSANPSFQFYSSYTTGPSGGLMQTIAVYNAITEYDITKGLKIAGTGTISIDGTVGAIGGAYQKVIAAHRNGVDVFFYPAGSAYNTSEVQRAYATLKNPTMQIVGVQTFDQAIDELNALGEE